MYCLVLTGCNTSPPQDRVSTKQSLDYSCSIQSMSFQGRLYRKDSGSLVLYLDNFELEPDIQYQSPLLDFHDLMHDASSLKFETTDADASSIFHTWQLTHVIQGDAAIHPKAIGPKILGTRNVHVDLVRLALNRNTQALALHNHGPSDVGDEHSDHDDSLHDHHGHDENEEHHAHEEHNSPHQHHDNNGHNNHHKHQHTDEHAPPDTSQTDINDTEGPSITFSVYQQLRGQRTPSWCVVTAPVDIYQEENVYHIEVIEGAKAATRIGNNGKYQRHHHDH